ncbi:nucleoside triphosphate pyrophosphohydrolase [Desertibacillus haloalkaliphilus]|uniref:nucleoside triphosphate pyrophosphohydrolase n=1 Tax=Desertibacillus haloalkaliphilus TaxID=1328930 RepID=UPI001C26A917|nr:nucleoside triphosphate pyrophosphohydrolase [Desertibacillus haloalkaliphilus]MBU8908436.1 nucleoside triphosphate pyrophosphohydrolase [Desertibacillus haloalkaliphilus]
MKKKINVIGLGAGDLNQMPIGLYKQIKEASSLYLRTKHHPVITELEQEGLQYTSFDSIYEEHDQFTDVYREISEQLFSLADNEEVTYAVPGHPLVAEQTVQYLLHEGPNQGIEVNILGGQSFLDPMYHVLGIDPIEGCQVVDGTALEKDSLQIRQHMIICQVYDSFIASEVKLTLMELLPDDYEVTIATAVGSAKQELVTVPLYELDRATEVNNLTAVYVPPVRDEQLLYHDFGKLRSVIATLRGPDGCPWDRKQTHESLKKYLIEETYEVLEAIDEQDDDHLAEELGDVLLQVMLHAQIGEDEGLFSIDDVIQSITEKMIRRHPHVFSVASADTAEEVESNWEAIKKKEKQESGQGEEWDSILDDVSKSVPALIRAYQLQKTAAKVGFDWDDVAPIWMKIQEEIAEFFTEVKAENKEMMIKEFGDILFALVNLGRYYSIYPEEALQTTNQKFTIRFQMIEEKLKERKLTFADVTLAEMDEIWEEAKKETRG